MDTALKFQAMFLCVRDSDAVAGMADTNIFTLLEKRVRLVCIMEDCAGEFEQTVRERLTGNGCCSEACATRHRATAHSMPRVST